MRVRPRNPRPPGERSEQGTRRSVSGAVVASGGTRIVDRGPRHHRRGWPSFDDRVRPDGWECILDVRAGGQLVRTSRTSCQMGSDGGLSPIRPPV
jgi:hypothetical protein